MLLNSPHTAGSWRAKMEISPASSSSRTGVHTVAGRPSPSSILGMLQMVLRTEGVLGLYRGISPTILGILPYAGLKFYVYQSLKQVGRQACCNGGGLGDPFWQQPGL